MPAAAGLITIHLRPVYTNAKQLNLNVQTFVSINMLHIIRYILQNSTVQFMLQKP